MTILDERTLHSKIVLLFNMDKGFLHSKVCRLWRRALWERALSLGYDNSLEVKGIIKFKIKSSKIKLSKGKAFSPSIMNLPAGKQVYGCIAHFCLLVIVYDPTFIYVSIWNTSPSSQHSLLIRNIHVPFLINHFFTKQPCLPVKIQFHGD